MEQPLKDCMVQRTKPREWRRPTCLAFPQTKKQENGSLWRSSGDRQGMPVLSKHLQTCGINCSACLWADTVGASAAVWSCCCCILGERKQTHHPGPNNSGSRDGGCLQQSRVSALCCLSFSVAQQEQKIKRLWVSVLRFSKGPWHPHLTNPGLDTPTALLPSGLKEAVTVLGRLAQHTYELQYPFLGCPGCQPVPEARD